MDLHGGGMGMDGQQHPQRRRAVDIEERRRQNRDAAARHRQRQQERLSTLERHEAVLQQRVSELRTEIMSLHNQREGLPQPARDPLTTTLLSMLETVDGLRSSLDRCVDESVAVVKELRCIARATERKE
ncbi:hypothetical protein H4R18_005212 [Coemansia javaensis]|uniref:BZIP domain-containing protein n=1 Tax=Coemansia javaensis TaxID=2761396 RepID=A0A9W8H9A7_9FUNG|nr:hypothetical protein H4R18_005212 [Coemansia javaensis]